jgi:glycosyltransferase involved in cell wall biosynthesis
MARIALIGPTYPYKGGIALHTTELAHRLAAAGNDVEIISWKDQYPSFLYAGEQHLKDAQPEITPFEPTTYPLAWYNPFGWWHAGRKLRKKYDQVIIIYFVPQIQGPVGVVFSWALGHGKHRPQLTALCHNVLPHEVRPGDAFFTRAFLKRADSVLVHSEEQAKVARTLTKRPVRIAPMAAHLPKAVQAATVRHECTQHQLVFFGMIRPYKGVDVLIRAIAHVPHVNLVIAGEAWGKTKDKLVALIDELHLSKRVTLKTGYVPAEELPELFAQADALVLPYRSSTGTQNVDMGFAHGVPVIATRVGTIAEHVRDQVDGLLCKADDVEDLVRTIEYFYEPGVAEELRRHVQKPSQDATWKKYVEILTKR